MPICTNSVPPPFLLPNNHLNSLSFLPSSSFISSSVTLRSRSTSSPPRPFPLSLSGNSFSIDSCLILLLCCHLVTVLLV
ncbi:hypothetical protein SLA2020_310860 [Shorea laevis]